MQINHAAFANFRLGVFSSEHNVQEKNVARRGWTPAVRISGKMLVINQVV